MSKLTNWKVLTYGGLTVSLLITLFVLLSEYPKKAPASIIILVWLVVLSMCYTFYKFLEESV